MLDGGVAERAVLGDDAQLAALLLGVGGEAVGGERVGHRVQRGAERPLAVGRRRPIAAAIARPYSTPTSSAIASAWLGRQQREGPAEQGDEHVVVADRHLEGHLVRGGAGSASTAARRRAPSPRSTATSR